ncbi:putative transporter [Zancudomyces culisetae]|uniref:Putative transporter n=1 Tax=Zancudomyces culisetae TaxID=1213189 RepID=A0A1R1PCE9_ZANCU|nr:putative transporter [Zancudomyces culisetae]|eukprot:OMH78647.1 putative transporter [Zancudomyces culisetae]
MEKNSSQETINSHDNEERKNVNREVELSLEDKKTLRRAILKIDLWILPIMYLLYLSGAMDRSNIGAAMINGMVEKLHLTPTQQGSVGSLFFITYILFEPFANILLKRTRPSIWFPFIGIGWSVTCMCLAAAQNSGQAILIRLILGVFEAGFTPGMITYLAYWYTREDLGPRMSIMFSALPASGIVNLLYGAFALIRIGNLIAYQSIFIFGGLITLLIAIAAIFLIKDYPEHATFLSDSERLVVVKRINASQGSAERSVITLSTIKDAVVDWKVWAFAALDLSRNNAFIVMGFVGPSIIKSFGYSSSTSTFLSSAVAITGTISTLVFGFFLQHSTPFYIRILVMDLLSAICFAIVAYSRNKILRLVFIFILGIPMYAVIPITISWMSINAGSTQKRALSSAIFVMIGSIAGIVSPYLFTTATAPAYTTGYAFAFALYALSFVLTSILAFSLHRMNKSRDANPRDVSHLSPEDQRAMHDFHPNFRYIL